MKAMILAAGLGTRMRPLTDNCPKPLLSVAGKPLIVHHIEKLVAKGITDIVINHAYLGHMIEAALGDGSQFGCDIQYSAESSALETGGGIFNALPLLTSGLEASTDAPFLLVNGDVWLNWDEVRIPENTLGQCYLWLVKNPEHNLEGDFVLKNTHQTPTSYIVEDKVEGSLKANTFSGISLLRPSLFKNAKPGAFPLAPMLREAMKREQVYGELYRGCWVDVGTPERLLQVEQLIKEQSSIVQTPKH